MVQATTKEDNSNPTNNNINFLSRLVKARLWRQNKNWLCMICGETGCQPKGSKVLMADGEFKNIEDIKKGDLILSPQVDGTNIFSKVTSTSSWFCDENYDVHQLNKFKKKLYTCSYNHLIPIYYRTIPRLKGKRESKNHYWSIKNYDAKEFNSLSEHSKNHRTIGFSSFKIKEFKDRKNCKIEPYSLGVFLGDGHFSHKLKFKINKNYTNIKKGRRSYFLRAIQGALAITSDDFEILEEVSKHYHIKHIQKKQGTTAKSYSFSLNSDFAKLLTKYNLVNKKSGSKFIPKEALLSDIDYRKKLLSGLIDTDGYYSKSKCGYSITTKSKQLAEDIYFLIYSLGGRCSIRKTKKQIKRLNFEGEYYDVSFYLRDLKLPLKLKRKRRLDLPYSYLASNRIAITTKPSKPSTVYGFELDSKSKLYITDNFMVTHNSGKSYVAMKLAESIDPNFNIDNTVFSADKFMELLNSGRLKKGSCVVFDEAGVGLPKREWYSMSNKMLNYILQTFRHENLAVIFTTPSFDFIDSDARKLFHNYIETKRIDYKKELVYTKLFVIQYNPRLGKLYAKYFRRHGNKINPYCIGKPSEELIEAYEDKKKAFTVRLKKEAELIIKETKKIKDKEETVLITDFEIAKMILADKKKLKELTKLFHGRKIVDRYKIQTVYRLSEGKSIRVKKLLEEDLRKKGLL